MISAFHSVYRLLTFKLKRKEMLNFSNTHLLLGIFGTWLVGMGRYWDDPTASLLQHLGLGSVIYIFALSLFIWLIVLPLKPKNWSYKTLLTFISLTSFPAALYAIPVERYMTIDAANTINVWFLAIVALWRLALLFYFIRVFARLKVLSMIAVTLLPMCIIVTSLFILNLHHVIFNLMGGVRNPTPHDSAYAVLMLLTGLSIILVGPLLLLYCSSIYLAWRNRKRTQE